MGLFYLLPSDIVFSLWFFFLFSYGEEWLGHVLVGPLPWANTGRQAALIITDQATGAAFVLVGLMVYTSWIRARGMWQRQLQADPQATNTLLSFRTAAWLVALSFVGIMLWWNAAGGSLPAGLAEFGIYLFVQAIIVSRGTSEAGIPMAPYTFTPLLTWGIFGYQSRVGRANLALMGFTTFVFTWRQKSLLITGMLDAQKIADGVRLHRSRLVGIIVLTLVFTIVLSGFLHLMLTYQHGAITMNENIYTEPGGIWAGQGSLAEGVEQYRANRMLWFGLGIALYSFLGIMRRLHVWWPLHPLGLVFSTTWAARVFWFPALCAWFVKTAIVRYGGYKMYTRLRPFFLGLICGEFFMAFYWTMVSLIYHTTPPVFPWW